MLLWDTPWVSARHYCCSLNAYQSFTRGVAKTNPFPWIPICWLCDINRSSNGRSLSAVRIFGSIVLNLPEEKEIWYSHCISFAASFRIEQRWLCDSRFTRNEKMQSRWTNRHCSMKLATCLVAAECYKVFWRTRGGRCNRQNRYCSVLCLLLRKLVSLMGRVAADED